MDLLCKKNTELILFLGTEILFSIKQCPLNFMSGNKWWSTKISTKLLSDLVTEIILHFYKLIQVVALKYLMYFLPGINTK